MSFEHIAIGTLIVGAIAMASLTGSGSDATNDASVDHTQSEQQGYAGYEAGGDADAGGSDKDAAEGASKGCVKDPEAAARWAHIHPNRTPCKTTPGSGRKKGPAGPFRLIEASMAQAD